ncbi:NlpC/P60 family protein [Bacillus cereus]
MVCEKIDTQIVPIYIRVEHSLESFFNPIQYAGVLLEEANNYFPSTIQFKLEQIGSIPESTLYEIQSLAVPRTITIVLVNKMQKKDLRSEGVSWKGIIENHHAGLIVIYVNPHDPFLTHLQTLIHELGHIYGLHHSLDVQGVMYPKQLSNESIYFTEQELDIILYNKGLYGAPKENCVCCREETENQLIDDYFPHIMEFALRYQNAPYQFLGIGDPSFDCSGLWVAAFNHVGIYLPQTVKEQFSTVQHISENQLQPGDLIFFTATEDGDYVSHVGMYIGGNYMYNSNRKNGIGFTDLTPYWQARIIGYGRVGSVVKFEKT